MDPLKLGIIVAVFIAVFVLGERLLQALFGRHRVEQRKLQSRLADISDTADIVKIVRDLQQSSRLDRWLESLRPFANARRLLRGAGIKLSLGQMVLISALLAVVAFFAMKVFGADLLAIFGAAAAAVVPWAFAGWRYKRRIATFESGLLEAMDIMVRSLKAGHPFNESMLAVAQETDGPTAEEFGLAFAELNYGSSIREVFDNLIDRVPNLTLRALSVAILLQRETGGNLAEVLEKANAVLRARFRFRRRVRTLSAEGRLSGWILSALPFVMFGVISLINPDYAQELITTPTGNTLLMAGATLVITGALWIRQIVKLDV